MPSGLTHLYEQSELNHLSGWFSELDLTIRRKSSQESAWRAYQKHLRDPLTWRIRKTVELVLHDSKQLHKASQRLLTRCILLRTSQWALDCRKQIPSVREFRDQLFRFAIEMIEGAHEYRKSVSGASHGNSTAPLCLNVGAADLHCEPIWNTIASPKLIVTSPPSLLEFTCFTTVGRCRGAEKRRLPFGLRILTGLVPHAYLRRSEKPRLTKIF